MRGVDRLLLPLLVATAALACAGGGGPPPPPVTTATTTADHGVQNLLARLDVLIATGDGDASVSAAVLAEARSLRVEALSAFVEGNDALASDLLASAIALFGDGPE